MQLSFFKTVLIAICGITMTLAGCTQNAGQQSYKIGLAAPLTGDSAQFGEMIRMGAEMKVDEINAAGGLHGKQVELVPGDDKANPKEAGIVAQRFGSDPEIYAVIGHFNSTCSKAGRPIYRDNKILQMSPGSTNVSVCEGFDFTFRNIYRDDFQGQSLASYAKQVLNVERAAIFFDNDDYGIGLKEFFKKEAEALGIEIVAEEAFVRETQDFTPQLTSMREKNPDIIFISGLYTQGALIARQARKLGIETPLLGADGCLSQELINLGGNSVEGMILSVPFLDSDEDPRVQEFTKAFEAKFQRRPDAWAALSYDAVGIVGAAIEDAGWDNIKIRDAVAAMDTPDVAYSGVTGLTYFDANGDCLKPLIFAKVENGTFVKAEQQLP